MPMPKVNILILKDGPDAETTSFAVEKALKGPNGNL